MNARAVWFLLAFIVAGVASAAEEPCYQYQRGGVGTLDTGWLNSITAVAQAHFEHCGSPEVSLGEFLGPACANTGHSGSGITVRNAVSYEVLGPYSSSNPEYLIMVEDNWGGSTHTHSQAVQINIRENPEGCPADPCEDAAELASAGLGVGADVEQSGQMCSADDGSGGAYSGGLYGRGCEVVKDGSGISSSDGAHWFGQVKYTGQSCPEFPEPQTLDSEANCLATSGGAICVSKSTKNCGTVNGERVCLDEVPPGECMLLSSGGAICDSTAENVPKDEMGEPLPPTATTSSTSGGSSSDPGDTTTYNYYSSSVVNSSSTQITGSSNDSATEGEGGGGEGESLDDLEGGDMGEVDTFGAVAGSFMDRVEASPLVSAVTGIGAGMGSGSCPDWDTEVNAGPFGQFNVDFSFICTMWDDIAGVIGAVMMALFAFAAVRILMSA